LTNKTLDFFKEIYYIILYNQTLTFKQREVTMRQSTMFYLKQNLEIPEGDKVRYAEVIALDSHKGRVKIRWDDGEEDWYNEREVCNAYIDNKISTCKTQWS